VEEETNQVAPSPHFFCFILFFLCKLADWKFETVDMAGQKSRRLVEESPGESITAKTLMGRRAPSTELMGWLILYCVCVRDFIDLPVEEEEEEEKEEEGKKDVLTNSARI
jgi:hypothetical protein